MRKDNRKLQDLEMDKSKMDFNNLSSYCRESELTLILNRSSTPGSELGSRGVERERRN